VSTRTGAATGTTGPARPDPLAVATAAALLVVAGAVLVLGLLVLTGADAPRTLGDPGPATTAGLPLARYLQDLLGVLVVGCCTVAALASGLDRANQSVRERARRLVLPVAAAWGAVTVAVYLLTASDLSGRALPLVLSPQVQTAYLQLPQARAQLLVLLAALVLAVASRLVAGGGRAVHAGLLAVASLGLLPPAFVGHSASAEDHELAVASVSVHLVAGALWVGGLAVLTVVVLADRRVATSDALPVVRSFSTLALGSVVVIGASGVLNGSLRVGSPEQLVGSPYGLVLVGKTLALLVLIGFGWWHRSRSIAALAGQALAEADGTAGSRGRGLFVRLATVELLVMVLTVAAAVVLARTPPPGV
jgi:putative copper export protein